MPRGKCSFSELNFKRKDDHKYVRDNTVNLIRDVISTLECQNIEIHELSDGIELLYFIMMDITNIIKYIYLLIKIWII